MKPPRTWKVAAAAVVLVALSGALLLFAMTSETGRGTETRSPVALPPLLTARFVPNTSDDTNGDRRQTSLQVADRIATTYDLTITSGYRDPVHNAAVGGAEGSYHTRGTRKNPGAVDLIGAAADMRRALTWAQAHVRNLAEGMIHAVCLVDDERPWQVTSSGLHLHLAFAETAGDPDAMNPYVSVETRSGCQAAADRFRAARRAILAKRSADVLSTEQAARATLRAASMALDGSYGRLGDRGRAIVVDVRRSARATLDRVIAARKHKQQPATPSPYDRYTTKMQHIDALEQAGSLTAAEADAQRLETIDAALAGSYGALTSTEHAAVVAEREALIPAATPDPPTTQTTTTPAAPTTSEQAPASSPTAVGTATTQVAPPVPTTP